MKLVLRDAQLRSFRAERLGALIDRIIVFLQQEEPGAGRASRSDLEREVRFHVERALGYGLETDRELAMFATAGWLLGRGFEEEDSALVAFLSDSAVSPLQRAQRLGQMIDTADRREPASA